MTIEKLDKGFKLRDEISSYKTIVEDAENAKKDGTIRGTLFAEGSCSYRIPLNHAEVLDVLNMVIADCKENIRLLEMEFKEL